MYAIIMYYDASSTPNWPSRSDGGNKFGKCRCWFILTSPSGGGSSRRRCSGGGAGLYKV